MSKKKASSLRQGGAGGQEEKEPTAMLSVRVTKAELSRLEQAAVLKGWKVATFLRTAALERAAHIINASTETAVSFMVPALDAAARLVDERTAYTLMPDGGGNLQRMVVADSVYGPDVQFRDEPPVEITPRELTSHQWQQFERAAKFGGAEFLELIVRICKSRQEPSGNRPEPIDPSTFSERE